ncbi:unnamed protein product [Anisakis simplex]|uniref:Ovule protein n=1 Tax=Anisakis simplex TaxID=6269 RepID=A0A0M3J3Z4_ANISI|nr:unnamed protein product [Anisakis simplex]
MDSEVCWLIIYYFYYLYPRLLPTSSVMPSPTTLPLEESQPELNLILKINQEDTIQLFSSSSPLYKCS